MRHQKNACPWTKQSFPKLKKFKYFSFFSCRSWAGGYTDSTPFFSVFFEVCRHNGSKAGEFFEKMLDLSWLYALQRIMPKAPAVRADLGFWSIFNHFLGVLRQTSNFEVLCAKEDPASFLKHIYRSARHSVSGVSPIDSKQSIGSSDSSCLPKVYFKALLVSALVTITSSKPLSWGSRSGFGWVLPGSII